jgi:AcrR family transcriptional regulator
MKRRAYALKKRAESKDATRDRIVAAAVALHEEVGPKETTISAIAERAGVQRLTVYRHFPDETAMFHACTSHWLSLNLPPSADAWNGIADPNARCHAALRALYRYYRRTQRMWSLSHRDEDAVPAMQGPMARFRQYLDSIHADLVRGLAPSQRSRDAVATTLRHALRFTTWASLAADGRRDDAAANLVMDWLAGCDLDTFTS